MPVFVVRVDRFEEEPDFKAFSIRRDAEQRFTAASVSVWGRDFPSAAWFEVATDNNREAVAAIKRADKSLVTLIDKEPRDIKIDLSGIIDVLNTKTS